MKKEKNFYCCGNKCGGIIFCWIIIFIYFKSFIWHRLDLITDQRLKPPSKKEMVKELDMIISEYLKQVDLWVGWDSLQKEKIYIPTRKTSKIQIPEPKSFWLSEQYSFQLKIKCCECTWTFLIGATFPFNFSSNNQLYTSNPSLRKGNFRSYVWNTSRLSHLKYEITKTKALL